MTVRTEVVPAMSPTRGQAADLIHSTEQKTVITLMDSYRHLEYIHPEHQFYAPGYQHVLYLGQLALGQHKLDVTNRIWQNTAGTMRGNTYRGNTISCFIYIGFSSRYGHRAIIYSSLL